MTENNEIINGTNVDDKAGLNTSSIQELTTNISKDVENTETEIEIKDPDKKSKTNVLTITDEMLEEEIGKLDEMNYLELQGALVSLQNKKNDLSDVKSGAEQLIKIYEEFEETLNNEVENLSEDINLSEALQLSNAEDDAGGATVEEAKEFLDNYEESVNKIDTTIESVKEKLKEFDNVKKTSQWISSQMLSIIDKKIEGIEEKMKISPELKGQLKDLLRYYRNLREMHQDRNSVEFLINWVRDNKSFVKRIGRDLQSNSKKNNSYFKNVSLNVSKAFLEVFSIEQLKSVEKYLDGIFYKEHENGELLGAMTYAFQYVLYTIYTNTGAKKFGKYKWVEMLYINIMDIITGNYDLEGGVEYYNDQLIKLKDEIAKEFPKNFVQF